MVDSPLCVLPVGRRRVGDESLVAKAADVAVQVARFDGDTPVRVLEDLAANGVAVPIAGAEHREDQELYRTEWGEARGVGQSRGHEHLTENERSGGCRPERSEGSSSSRLRAFDHDHEDPSPDGY